MTERHWYTGKKGTKKKKKYWNIKRQDSNRHWKTQGISNQRSQVGYLFDDFLQKKYFLQTVKMQNVTVICRKNAFMLEMFQEKLLAKFGVQIKNVSNKSL